MYKLTHWVVPWDEAASCVPLSGDCSAPWTPAWSWLATASPTDAEFRSSDRTRSSSWAPPGRQRGCEVGPGSHRTGCGEAAAPGTPRAWGTRWLGTAAVPASGKILNSALPRAERGPAKQGTVSSVHLGRQAASKVNVQIHHGKHSSASNRNFEKLQKSADCFWTVFQGTWGSDLVNLRWLLIPWWRILNAIMLRKLSESKTSYSHRPVSLFAIISTYPTAYKELPKFQWQQRHFCFYEAKLSFLQSNNLLHCPTPSLETCA